MGNHAHEVGPVDSGRAPEYCLGCGRGRRGDEYKCPSCGCTVYDHTVPGDLVGDEAGPDSMLAGPLGRVLALPPGDTALVSGPKGCGKSSICFRAMPGAWIVSSEMAPPLVNSYCLRLGVEAYRVSVPRYDEHMIDLGIDVDDPRVVDLVIDSISACPNPAAVLAGVRQLCRDYGMRALLVAHVTKAGDVAGAAKMGHDVDAVVRVEVEAEHRRITIEKTRAGITGSALFDLTADGVRGPEWSRFYSVEGRAPGYRVVPFPTGERRLAYASLLRAAAHGQAPTWWKAKPPKPPFAVSALDGGDLYPGKWVEPADGAARREFALSHGLPYLDAKGVLHTPNGGEHGDT